MKFIRNSYEITQLHNKTLQFPPSHDPTALAFIVALPVSDCVMPESKSNWAELANLSFNFRFAILVISQCS
jgi:hypothetical protein